MSFEKSPLTKILKHIYEHFLLYLNGLNTICFTIVGILFSIQLYIWLGGVSNIYYFKWVSHI